MHACSRPWNPDTSVIAFTGSAAKISLILIQPIPWDHKCTSTTGVWQMALEAFKPLKKCPSKIEMHFAQCFFQMVRKYCTLKEVHQIKECLTAQYIHTDSRKDFETDIALESLPIYEPLIFWILAWSSPTVLYDINRRGGVGKRVYKQVVAWYGWPLVWTGSNSSTNEIIILGMVKAITKSANSLKFHRVNMM